MRNKVVSAEEAVAVIHDGDMLATSGFVGIGTPDALLAALERRFLETGSPKNLQLLFAAGQGDGKTQGLNRVGHEGLLARVIGGHWGLIPKVGALALQNRIEAYNFPQGCISRLYREIAAHGPGIVTKIGLETFVDPRLGGGKLNDRTTEDLVELIRIDGEEWLFYKALPIQVAFIRGTTADPNGNITMEREALTLDNLAIATAAKNSHGVVIAQVERAAAAHSLNARDVEVPGVLVDCVVLADAEHHKQTYAVNYSPAFAGEIRAPIEDVPPLALDIRKIIARRCALELPINGVINLGIGMPEGVAAVAAEERLLDHLTLTAEPGVIGGMPAGGLSFGAAINTDAIIAQNQQFDFYDGGGLDLACLGMAQVDCVGNVNVSRFEGRLAGAGGFINISQTARKLIFAGAFTAGGLEVDIADHGLSIRREGERKKFRAAVEQITFSGKRAARLRQPVLYVTERCVFRLAEEGVELIEIAPGIDLERDVLQYLEFTPIIGSLTISDARLYRPEPMGLYAALLNLKIADRIAYDAARNILFVNLEGLHIRNRGDMQVLRSEIEARCSKVGRKVRAIVNYDAFRLDPELETAYAEFAAEMESAYYEKISRYTTSAFMRLKLGAFLKRTVAPHIFESKTDAARFLEENL
ncbi:MAG TPA: CoA-transferase [Parvularculaceae bacterium]|nr:CoA-transferase [Parvularculaceae bacterium]